MTNDVKIKLGSLDLGTLKVLDASALPDLATNGLHNFLALVRAKGELELRYRHMSPVERGPNSNSSYELNLGTVLAASAVVFSTPLAAAPSQVAAMLLVRAPSRSENASEQLQIILVHPSRDGNIDTARLADDVQQDALRDAIAEDAVKLASVEAETANMAALIRQALLGEANIDIRLPIDEEDLPAIELKLPENLAFDEEGVFYFRDVLDGGHDVLLTDESEFTDLQFEISVVGGVFYQLEDDEEFIASYLSDGETVTDDETKTKIAFHLKDIEASLSRLVVIADQNSENVRVDITVFNQEQLILENSVTIELAPPKEEALGYIDLNEGLPEDDYEASRQDDDTLPLGEVAYDGSGEGFGDDQEDTDLSSLPEIL